MINGLGGAPDVFYELRDKDGNLKQRSRKEETWYLYTHYIQEDAKGNKLGKLVYDWYGRLKEQIVWDEKGKKTLHLVFKYDKEGNSKQINKLEKRSFFLFRKKDKK
jgi:hypothetical protein